MQVRLPKNELAIFTNELAIFTGHVVGLSDAQRVVDAKE
jgi:hypothetical protein